MALGVLAHPVDARADGYDGSHEWIDRAMSIVVSIGVPDTRDPGKILRKGFGFFVGIEGQTAYLVTAGHVIWPNDIPDAEKVKLDIKMELPECRASLSAVADSAYASPKDELDMALVAINLTDVPNDTVNHCQKVITHLPRHILDPLADNLPENAQAWLIGPAVWDKGINARPARVARPPVAIPNKLQFQETVFRPGDSGSPIFSDKGYVIGMAIEENNNAATKYSMILTKLHDVWKIRTNLTGLSANLVFSGDSLSGEWHRTAKLSIEGDPVVPLQVPQPVPLGREVKLALWINNTQKVEGTVNVRAGIDMDCDVTISCWLARHRRVGVYTTPILAAATGVVLAIAETSGNSFGQSPSTNSRDRVRLFNGITIGVGSVALVSLAATVVGYAKSDTTGITCSEKRR